MDLVYCVATLGVAVLLSVVVLLGTRMPRTPAWASEGMVSNVWCVVLVGLFAFATAYAVEFLTSWSKQPYGLRETGLTLATVLACALALAVIAPRRRLAAYAAARERGPALAVAGDHEAAGVAAGSTPRERGPSDKPFPRAA